jgi:hypothetical protein
MYGHMPNVYTITDGLVWSHKPHTYLSLGKIPPTSWDTYVGVATSACRIDFSYKNIYIDTPTYLLQSEHTHAIFVSSKQSVRMSCQFSTNPAWPFFFVRMSQFCSTIVHFSYLRRDRHTWMQWEDRINLNRHRWGWNFSSIAKGSWIGPLVHDKGGFVVQKLERWEPTGNKTYKFQWHYCSLRIGVVIERSSSIE